MDAEFELSIYAIEGHLARVEHLRETSLQTLIS
jgi:hypothetical protein